MSYILDALRRAEAERERGAVPSLQSQQHTVIEEEEAAPRSRRLLLWVIVGLGGALLALLAWTIFGGTPAPSRPIAEGSVPRVSPVAIAPAPTAPPPPPTSDAPPAPAAAAPATAAITAPIVAPSVPAPRASVPAAVRQAAVAPAEARRSARRAGADPALAGMAPPATSSARVEARIYALAELPEDIRREIPKVSINGSSYSGDAASRMVMINGQVFHEGDTLSAGLVLEKINRRSAVLAYKGWRYEIAF